MNKNIKKLAILALAGLTLCGTAVAAPHRGRGPAGHGGRGAPAPRQMQAPRGGGHMARPTAPRPAARPAPRPAPMHHRARIAPPPPRHHFGHHHPAGARFWARPVCPPPRFGALRAWTWVATAWNMIVDGVYYYGDGYYYDGYNYYYNGAYYTTPPGTTVIVNQPTVIY